jgi:hypothetical protein
LAHTDTDTDISVSAIKILVSVSVSAALEISYIGIGQNIGQNIGIGCQYVGQKNISVSAGPISVQPYFACYQDHYHYEPKMEGFSKVVLGFRNFRYDL